MTDDRTKDLLEDIDTSLSRIADLTTCNSFRTETNEKFKNITFTIKVIVVAFLALLIGAGATATLVFFHLNLDQERFMSVQKQIDIMNQRTEFLMTWQKSIQEQVVSLHSPPTQNNK